MPQPTEQNILDTLRRVKAPGGGEFDASALIEGLAVKGTPKGAVVQFAIKVDARNADVFEPLREAAEQAVRALPGVVSVSAVLTEHKAAPQMRGGKPEKLPIQGVRHVVAVASGKGGVGKSTTAVNLAAALAEQGRKTGLLDADIYGPSIPRMLNIKGKPQVRDDKKLLPMEHYGIQAMSMGFLIDEGAPMIWRGPMVHGALTQLLREVAWDAAGPLDILVIDLPPGTGDAQLTLAQSAPLSGAVIVSTPQDIALLDARKGLAMFRRVEVPVLGLIENMSYFLCPHCGERSEIFSHGGARAEAEKLGLPFLGEIPLDIAVREASDAGKPIALTQSESAIAGAYRNIAEQVWKAVNK